MPLFHHFLELRLGFRACQLSVIELLFHFLLQIMMQSLYLCFMIESDPWPNFLFLISWTHIPCFYIIQPNGGVNDTRFSSNLLSQLLVTPWCLKLYVVRTFELQYLCQLLWTWLIVVIFSDWRSWHTFDEIGDPSSIISCQLIGHLIPLLRLFGPFWNHNFALMPCHEIICLSG